MVMDIDLRSGCHGLLFDLNQPFSIPYMLSSIWMMAAMYLKTMETVTFI